jgi:hypothetical protein
MKRLIAEIKRLNDEACEREKAMICAIMAFLLQKDERVLLNGILIWELICVSLELLI